MFQVSTISSFEDPRLAPYRNMRRQYDHAAQEIFVAEGEKVVRRLLESDLTILSVLFPPKWLAEFEPLLQRRTEHLDVFTADKNVLQDLTGFSMYQGVLALARIPRAATLDEVFRGSGQRRFLVAIDGLSNPENVGGLVRNSVAFGVDALIVGETSCIPYLRRAVRSSMATVFKLPYVVSAKLADTVRELRRRGMRCIAAHPHTDRRIFQSNFAQDCCIVLGAEGTGISPEVLEACDEAVAIPMQNEVDSLNVGSAAAVFLYEVARQRELAGKQVEPGEGREKTM